MKTKILGVAAVMCLLALGIWLFRSPKVLRNVQDTRSPSAPATTGKTGGLKNTPAANTIPQSSPPIQALVDVQQSYEERAAAVETLSTNLSLADETALKDFLLRPGRDDAGQLSQVLKNELMNELCSFSPPPAWLADVLVGVYRDKGQDPVVRDYAVQHLAALYPKSPTGSDAQDIRNVLNEALTETDSSIAGTALLALERLSQNQQFGFDQKQVATQALKLASTEGTSELTQITAFQVCGHLNVQDAVPSLVQAAQNGSTMSVRISAIGALGMLGGTQVEPLLNGLANGDEPRLQLPARQALNRIQNRQQMPGNNRRS